MEKPYRDLNGHLRARLGKKTVKLCIDGGFTCPNRDGTVGRGGCLFCGARGAGDFTDPSAGDIAAQVRARLDRPRAGRVNDSFVAYFQSFSCTYAPCGVLAARYRAALCDPRIRALAVATRPDCINEENAALLAELAGEKYVWVELGLQTASEETAARMRIGCPREAFTRAAALLARHGIDTVAHMMVGLPGEGRAEARATLELINRSPVTGLKIHATYVTEGSGLADLWRAGDYTPLTAEEYIDTAVDLLTHARPDLIIHRLTGDCPRELLLAPAWSRNKNYVLNEIHRRMWQAELTQGCFYT